jgi:methylated-DNA-[protein]-cysteine S-methyltransferase
MKLLSTELMLYVSSKYQESGDLSTLIGIFTTRRNGVWFSVAVNRKGKLVACAFSDRSRHEVESALPKKIHGATRRNRDGSEFFRILTTFYNGKGRKTSLRVADFSAISDFRRDVYEVLCNIPLGKVTTYGAIAKRLGGKRYARAVGTAVATNPLPLIIPCHRVVPSSLRVGNYGMCGRNPATGGYMKRMLLEREGVKFQREKVSKESIWVPN